MKQKLISLRNNFIEGSFILLSYILMFIGILVLFSASKGVISKESYFLKQIFWIVIGSILIYLLKEGDYRNLYKTSYLFYFISLILLVIVLIKGEGRAARWIELGGFYLQPSEFAKLVIILVLSSYLSSKDIRRIGVLIGSIMITFIPFFLIFKQPNLGTAIIFILIFIGIAYIAGITKKQLISILIFGILCFPILWHLMEDYQKDRILTFINPMRDPLGKGYNLLQAKITIGSGGFIGKGFLKGTQTKLAFLPEYHTDFIFCLIAEEFGFLGVIIFISIYLYFLFKILDLMYIVEDTFGKLITAGIFVMFSSQFLINLGMTIGLFPIVGIPLPFISYGGSSLISSILAVILLTSIKNKATFI